MGGGLVRNFPDAVDPLQIVEIDPSAGFIGSRVEAELHSSGIAHLRHGYDSANDVPEVFLKAIPSQSRLEPFKYQMLMQGALGVV